MEVVTAELFEYRVKARLWQIYRGMSVAQIERLRICCCDNAHSDHEAVMVEEPGGGHVPACQFCGKVLHPF